MSLKMIHTKDAPAAIGPYSQAIQAGGLLYTSGQIPLDVDGNIVAGGISEQTHQVFANLKAILKAANAEWDQVIKATVYIKDMNQFAQVNEIYATYFGDHKPARSTVEVARLPRDVLVEIDFIVKLHVE